MSGTRDTPRDLEDAPVYGSQKNPEQGKWMDSYLGEEDLLAPEHAKTMGRNIFSASTNWLNSGRRLKWNDSLRAFQGLHPSGSKYASADYRYRSRLFRPKTRAMVRGAEASTAQAFFANEDIVNITAIDDDDPMQQASAEINKQLIQHRLTKTIPWFLTLVGARQDAEVMGICIGKTYWKYAEKKTDTIQKPKLDASGMQLLQDDGTPSMEDYDVFLKTQDHPWIDLVAAENFRFDSAADWRNPVATSPYTIEMIPMYIADVMERVKSGEWNNVAESAIRSSVDLDDDATRRSREQGRVPGKDHDAWKPREFDICWVRENIVRWKGKEWHFFSLSSAGELLTNPRPLEEVYLHGIRPYTVGFVLPEAHKVYPTSKVELVKDLQTQTNDVTNLRLDNVKLALNPRQFVQGGNGVDPQDIRSFNPGKVVILSGKTLPRDAVEWDRPPEVTASAYQEQERLNMDFDELTGGLSYTTMQSAPQMTKTVGNMELMDGNASVLEEYDQRVFVETFAEPIIRHLVLLEQAYETDPVILAMAGQKAQLYQKFGMNEITDNLLKQELTVRVNVGMGATNPDKKLKKFLTAAQAVGQLFGPAASMGAKFEEVVKEVFSLCGYKDGARFFEKGFDVHKAQQAMAQGKGGKEHDPQQAQAEMQLQQAESQSKIAIANATQQAQAKQDEESHRMDMMQQQQQFQYKMEEMQTKFQLEMQKEQVKMQGLHMKHQHDVESRAQDMEAKAKENAAKPAVNVSSEALTKSSDHMNGMAKQHSEALHNLGHIIKPLAQATIKHGQTLEHLMKQTGEGHHAMAEAINRLATAHSTPKKRRAVRDGQGKLIGVEDYV